MREVAAGDLGIVTVISFNLLINAAVLISFEDTMTEFARMYNPSLPASGVGGDVVQIQKNTMSNTKDLWL